jgi:hypothetical protein
MFPASTIAKQRYASIITAISLIITGCAPAPYQMRTPTTTPVSPAAESGYSIGTYQNISGPGKTQEQFKRDMANCQNFSYNSELYIACMNGFGNTVYDVARGIYYRPSQQYASPLIPTSPRPLETAPSGGSVIGVPVVARFRNILEHNSRLIFEAAHPLGTLDVARAAIKQEGANQAVVSLNFVWHGRRETYQSSLQFELQYQSAETIDLVNITVSENSPYSAFSGAEAIKQGALIYLADKVKEKGGKAASLAIRVLNSATSVKGSLAELLKELANPS